MSPSLLPSSFNTIFSSKGGNETSKDDEDATKIRDYAAKEFEKHFGYKFDFDGDIHPTGASDPPNVRSDNGVKTFKNPKSKDEIQAYLKSILDTIDIPSWLLGQAEKDLSKLVDGVLDAQPDQYSTNIQDEKYTPQDLTLNGPVKANAVLVYINTVKKKGHVEEKKTQVCYLGVYFDIDPSLPEVKEHLRVLAYTAAAKAFQSGATIGDDAELTAAASSYTGQLFEQHYRYKWDQNPPDYIDDGSYPKTKTDALGYFEDGKADGVESFVQDKVFQGFTLPQWTKDPVSDVSGEFSDIVTKFANNRTWESLNYDRTYFDSKTGTQNSLRVAGVITYYTSTLKLYNKTVVQIAYVFWLGVIYEKLPLKTIVYNDMIIQLFNHLRDSGVVPESGLSSDKAGLIELLSLNASAKFEKAFGYEFKLSKSKPSDSTGDEVYGVQVFGEFPHATEDNISQWTTDNIFKDGTFSFFKKLPALKSKLDDRISYWLTENTVTTNGNEWGVDQLPESYDHPSDGSKTIEGNIIVYYANPSITEKGYSEKNNFFYFTGVYYVGGATEEGPGSDEDDI